MKPREFWIFSDCQEYDHKPSTHPDDKPFDIHVIEYSAYEKICQKVREFAHKDLLGEIKTLHKELDGLKETLRRTTLSWNPDIQDLKKERDEYREALEYTDKVFIEVGWRGKYNVPQVVREVLAKYPKEKKT